MNKYTNWDNFREEPSSLIDLRVRLETSGYIDIAVTNLQSLITTATAQATTPTMSTKTIINYYPASSNI